MKISDIWKYYADGLADDNLDTIVKNIVKKSVHKNMVARSQEIRKYLIRKLSYELSNLLEDVRQFCGEDLFSRIVLENREALRELDERDKLGLALDYFRSRNTRYYYALYISYVYISLREISYHAWPHMNSAEKYAFLCDCIQRMVNDGYLKKEEHEFISEALRLIRQCAKKPQDLVCAERISGQFTTSLVRELDGRMRNLLDQTFDPSWIKRRIIFEATLLLALEMREKNGGLEEYPSISSTRFFDFFQIYFSFFNYADKVEDLNFVRKLLSKYLAGEISA